MRKKQVGFHLDVEQLNKIKELAGKNSLTVAFFIRRAIDEYLKKIKSGERGGNSGF